MPSEKTPPEGTRVDLGEDLLQGESRPGAASSPKSASRAPTTRDLPRDLNDELESARILMGEGLLEDAKKILRKILLADSRHVESRKMLQEIHDRELKQIFHREDTQPFRLQRGQKENPLAAIDSESLMRSLDRDLGLGVFAGPQSSSEHEQFAQRIEKEVAGLASRDRMDVGIAFMEMGAHDIAAKLFKAASRDPDHSLAATFLLATSLIAADRAFEAILCLEPVLGDSEQTSHDKIHFIYLLGRARERLLRNSEAAQSYREILAIDPTYRDAADRLKLLNLKLESSLNKGRA